MGCNDATMKEMRDCSCCSCVSTGALAQSLSLSPPLPLSFSPPQPLVHAFQASLDKISPSSQKNACCNAALFIAHLYNF